MVELKHKPVVSGLGDLKGDSFLSNVCVILQVRWRLERPP